MEEKFNKETIDLLNGLLQACFQANSFCDNLAYSLDCELGCPIASKLYHEGFAHVFPSALFADGLSEVMVHEGIRPVRLGLEANVEPYENIVVAFEDNYRMMANFKNSILSGIEVLDFDAKCKVFVVILEEMALKASKMEHLCDIWRKKATQYFESGSVFSFDKDFEKFSDFNF